MKYLSLLLLVFSFNLFASDEITEREITVSVGDIYEAQFSCKLNGQLLETAHACARGAAVESAFNDCKSECQHCVLKKTVVENSWFAGRTSYSDIKASFRGLNCSDPL